MKSDKRQSQIMISVVLIVIAGVLIVASLLQPRVYVEDVDTQQINSTVVASNSSVNVNVNISNEVEVDVSIEFPVNLNTATTDDLMAINGIGEKIAYSIVDYRDSIGGYTSKEQIKDISGIGDSVYESIEPYITV